MTDRIDQTFARLKAEKRAALIPFLMAGDPSMEVFATLLQQLPQAGADIIEIGMPFSDPMADGPVIQAAATRARAAGANIPKTLQAIAQFRANNKTTPLVLMGYYNPVFHYGAAAFFADAAKAGVDGLILVDIPLEEEAEIRPLAEKNGIALIRLIAPTSIPERLPALCKDASGYLYLISMTGITGAALADLAPVREYIAQIRAHTSLPVAVGFGLKTPQQVQAVGEFAEGVVVGSALVDIIANYAKEPAKAPEFIHSLAKALAAQGNAAA